MDKLLINQLPRFGFQFLKAFLTALSSSGSPLEILRGALGFIKILWVFIIFSFFITNFIKKPS